jgi:hypothetical protein
VLASKNLEQIRAGRQTWFYVRVGVGTILQNQPATLRSVNGD